MVHNPFQITHQTIIDKGEGAVEAVSAVLLILLEDWSKKEATGEEGERVVRYMFLDRISRHVKDV